LKNVYSTKDLEILLSILQGGGDAQLPEGDADEEKKAEVPNPSNEVQIA